MILIKSNPVLRTTENLKPFSGKFTTLLPGRILLVLVIAFLSAGSAKAQCVDTVYAGKDTAVCLNTPLSITATTIGGTVISYTWSTVPASTTVTGNPFTVPTTTAGTVTYVVSADFQDGCTATDTIDVTIDPFPIASFTFSQVNNCGAFPVSFANTSSGIGLSYEWDFGDPNSGVANTSTATSPTHKFIGTPGTGTQNFTVTLIITSNGGCKDTVTHQVTTLQSPGTELGGTGQAMYNGLHYFTTCSNSTSATFDFTNQSSTVATNIDYKIVWGDGSPDFTATNFNNTSHTYSIGTYTLHFIVTGGTPNSCTDTTTYYVFLGSNPAVGLNNPGNTAVCTGAPLTFPITGTFTNPPGTIYTTTFNDGTAPVIFTHPAPPGVSHEFDISSCGTTSSDGTNVYPNSFSAVIVASNPCGNSSSGVVPIYVSQKPEALFTIDPGAMVCTSNTVTLTNASNGNSVVNGICLPAKPIWTITPATGWTLSSGTLGNDFGLADPTTWLSGSDELKIKFNTVGTYTVRLKAGTSAWCSTDFIEQTICVSAVPVAAFDVDQNTGCGPLIVRTTNNSNPSFCGDNSYIWSVSYTPTAGCVPATSAFTYFNGTNATSVIPQFEFTNPGIYTISLIAVTPGGTCSSAPVTKQITVKGKPNLVLSPFADICENQSVNPTLVSSCYITSATYAWSFPSGTPVSSVLQNPGLITYTNPGTYNISVDATNECGTTTASQPLNVLTVTAADAGPAQEICGTTATLAGNTPAIGTGQWSLASGPNTPVITNASSPNTTVTGLIPGTYLFDWTVTNGSCVSTSTVTITIVTGPTQADAGPDQNFCLATTATLAGNTPTLGTGQWSLVSGPNTPVITNPSSPNTTVTGLVPGVYTFRWSINFSNCAASIDDVQITIYDNPTVADAGTDQTICSSIVTVAGNAPVVGSGTWTMVSGPNSPVISNPASPSTTINGLVPGTYTFRWTITNGNCPPSADDVEITVAPFPTPSNAGPDQILCAANNTTLAGNIPAIGTGQWSLISGPNTPTITDPALNNTTVTGLVPGNYIFRWTITNGVCPPSTDDVLITINDNVTIADAGSDQIICSSSVNYDRQYSCHRNRHVVFR